MAHTLRLKVNDDCLDKEFITNYYSNLSSHYKGDCGVDLILPSLVTFDSGKVNKVNLGVSSEMFNEELEPEGFKIYARSSISNTELMLANGVGVVDPQYRGPLIAAFRAFDDCTASKGDRLVQIVAFDGKPIRVELVEELSNTERGANGFGSTGK